MCGHPVEDRNSGFLQSSVYPGGVPRYDVQQGGKSVGHVLVQDDHETPGGSVVENLYVDPAHRRRGLGRQLLGQVKANHRGPLRIRPRPHSDMPMDIEGLKGFYESEGFKPTGDKRDNMILDKLAFAACVAELVKLAVPLDPEEKELFKKVIENQQKFDAMASSGKMNEAQREAHRANTERIQHFMNKRKDSANKIPGWARDPMGQKPGGTTGRAYGGPPPGAGGRYRGTRPPAGPVMRFISKHPYVAAAGAGAAYGGLLGGLTQGLRSKREKKLDVAKAKKQGGPISVFAAKHPGIASAGLGAMTMPSVIYGAHKAGLPGLLAGSYAPGLGIYALDQGLKRHRNNQSKEERNRKRREEYAREVKTPKVTKPVAGPKVSKPKAA